MLSSLLYALRHASRRLIRDRGFAAVAIVSIALGVGANAAIFSLVDQVLLRLLPVKEPERLVTVSWNGNAVADGWGSGNITSYPLCQDLREHKEVFDGVFCRHPTSVNLSTGEEVQPVNAEIVSGSYFPVLGVRAALGRLIEESDNRQPGAHPVIVLSFDYWKNSLASDPDVVGRKVLVNNHPMTVIGVAADGFRGVDLGETPALWIPAMMKAQATPEWDRLLDRRARWVHIFGRLKPGVSAEQAEARLQPWFKTMLEADTKLESWPPVSEEQRRSFLASTIGVTPAPRGRSGLRNRLEDPLRVLMAGTLLLLLLACLNVANLFLARASARSREMAVRKALGASRSRIAAELLTDSLLVALAGGLLGLVAAPAVTQTLLSFLPQDSAGIDLSARTDLRVFLFAFLVSVITGCLCGVAPALQAGRVPLMSPLKDRSNIAAGGGIHLRKALVIGQMAFTLILLVGAGLFVQTLARLQKKGPGFTATNLLMFEVNPPKSGYGKAESVRFIRDLLGSLKALPGVDSATVADIELLMGGSRNMNMTVESESRVITDRVVHFTSISAGFFGTLGTRVIAGRDFDERDVREANDYGFRSGIINESFAKRYFGDRSPIGHRLGLGNRPDTTLDVEIVGVVKDFSYRGLREQAEHAFFPIFEGAPSRGVFYVRSRAEPDATFASVREVVRQLDPALPVSSMRTVEQQIDRSLTTERMLATLSGGFGILAIVLATVGLYGVMSFVVTRRTQEIGIRLALGATRSATLWLVMREAILMIAGGIAIALPCVWALSRLVESQLFGVAALDGPTIALASALLALVAAGAAAIPARRASLVNPTEALRFE
jgi:predicted permease